MSHFIPSFNLDEQPAELIFVLDRSGSMQGKSINLARKALLVLESESFFLLKMMIKPC